MLGYFIKYVGSSSYDAPAVLSLLIHMQYEQGLWYVKGGIHKLARALEQLAIEEGVTIHTVWIYIVLIRILIMLQALD
ncbi:hypothetical protein BDW31_10112 [Staphylococcus sp. AtHG25]|nr:hypothetical protein BDW31_10112 [Staphylococcus sp. AtHG25]